MHAPGIIAIAAFLRRQRLAVADWEPRRLVDWLRWHRANGGLGAVLLRGRIVAVGVARCVRELRDGRLAHYTHHENDGRILWVDQLASVHPLGLPILLAQARRRFGPRAFVSGYVFKRPGELRMLPWSRVDRLLSHHGLT